MKTTLHNHILIEEEGKPLVPNIIFKSLLHLITNEDNEAADYIIQNYSFTPDQVKLYQYYKLNKKAP